VVILGREQPSARDAERRAMAIWYDTKEPIRRIPAGPKGQVQYPYRVRQYTLHDGTRQSARVRVQPDRRVQAVVEQVREAEMVQAIDRLRLIHSEREKTVFILCNIPLDILVDELVTWRELVGDGRLTDALAACEDKGWDALPLAPGELTRLFPELWGTEKAAETWLGKNPLDPLISIRLWGVIHLYRPSGRRGKWSRALVRHGADPRITLSSVLGLPAENIQVKEGAGSEPLITASTVPSPRPSNPNPNKAGMRSRRAVPGSPAGDRYQRRRCRGESHSQHTSPRPRGAVPRGKHRRPGPRRRSPTRTPTSASPLGTLLL
jgi:hypothetical protein